jgi:hypothetical protein
MKLKLALFTCATLVLAATPIAVWSQDDVRGAFLVSRPKEKTANTNTAPRTSRRRPKANPTKTKDPQSSSGTTAPSGPTTKTPPTSGTTSKNPTAVNKQRIGLGLTLFARDSNGNAVRTDPTKVFQKGDGVRVLVETNTDGYIYIFNTTNNGSPVMIYPNAELDEAGNYLQAHVPFEIPSSVGTDERLRWLVFDENAGDERLFFVFTREPLAGVPIEDELITYCAGNKGCSWKPTEAVWALIQNEASQPLKSDKAKQYGAPQTQREQQASTRGLGLAKDDPPPSLIMMASSDTSTLVTTLDLIHK